jgi:hypothetical protein
MIVLMVVVVVIALAFLLVPRGAGQHLSVDVPVQPPPGILDLPTDAGLPPEPTRTDAGAPPPPDVAMAGFGHSTHL